MNTQEQPVTASLVAEAQRLDFLPAYFGPRLMMRGEALVYAWLRRLCERYNGAYWHYYTLSDGGFYMAPDLADRLEIEVDGNGTAIMTESSWINSNRNPGLTKAQVEAELKANLGLRKIIWLPGIKGRDITDAHVDFYARFVRPGVVDPGRHGGIQALQASAHNLLSSWSDGPPEAALKTRHVDLQHRNFGEFKVPSLTKKNHCELFIKSTNKFLLNDAANTIKFILDAETTDSD